MPTNDGQMIFTGRDVVPKHRIYKMAQETADSLAPDNFIRAAHLVHCMEPNSGRYHQYMAMHYNEKMGAVLPNNFADLYVFQAEAAKQLYGNTISAAKHAYRAKAKASRNVDTIFDRAVLGLRQYAKDLYDANHLGWSFQCFKHVSELSADFSDDERVIAIGACMSHVEALIEHQKYEEASSYLMDGLSMDPKNEDLIVALKDMAEMLYQKDNIPKAIEAMKTLVRVAPTEEYFRASLGAYYTESGHYVKAIEVYQDAIRMHQQKDDTYAVSVITKENLLELYVAMVQRSWDTSSYEDMVTYYTKAAKIVKDESSLQDQLLPCKACLYHALEASSNDTPKQSKLYDMLATLPPKDALEFALYQRLQHLDMADPSVEEHLHDIIQLARDGNRLTMCMGLIERQGIWSMNQHNTDKAALLFGTVANHMDEITDKRVALRAFEHLALSCTHLDNIHQLEPYIKHIRAYDTLRHRVDVHFMSGYLDYHLGRDDTALKYLEPLYQRLAPTDTLLAYPRLNIAQEILNMLQDIYNTKVTNILCNTSNDHRIEDAENALLTVGACHHGLESRGFDVELTPENRQRVDEVCEAIAQEKAKAYEVESQGRLSPEGTVAGERYDVAVLPRGFGIGVAYVSPSQEDMMPTFIYDRQEAYVDFVNKLRGDTNHAVGR